MLRPLRTLNKVESMRMIVTTLLKALPQLGDVMLLVMLEYCVYGIIAVQLLGKSTNFQCALLENPYPQCVGCDQPLAQPSDGGLPQSVPIYLNTTDSAMYDNFTVCDASCTLPPDPVWRLPADPVPQLCRSPMAHYYPERYEPHPHTWGYHCPPGWWCTPQQPVVRARAAPQAANPAAL